MFSHIYVRSYCAVIYYLESASWNPFQLIDLVMFLKFCFLWIRKVYSCTDFPGGSEGKASVYNVRDLGLIPGLGRFPGEGNGNPLQSVLLPWKSHGWKSLVQATVHGVAKSWAWLSDFIHSCTSSVIERIQLISARKVTTSNQQCFYQL